MNFSTFRVLSCLSASALMTFGTGCAAESNELATTDESTVAGKAELVRRPAIASGCPSAPGLRVVDCGAPLNAEVEAIVGETVFSSVARTWDPNGPKDIYRQAFGTNRASLLLSNVVSFKATQAAAYWLDTTRTRMFRRATGATSVRSISAAQIGARVFVEFAATSLKLVFVDGLAGGNYFEMKADLSGAARLTGYSASFSESPFLPTIGSSIYGYAADGFGLGFLKRYGSSSASGITTIVNGLLQIRSNPVEDQERVYTLVRGNGFFVLRSYGQTSFAGSDLVTGIPDRGENSFMLAMDSGRLFAARPQTANGETNPVMAIDLGTGSASVALSFAASGLKEPMSSAFAVYGDAPVQSTNVRVGAAQSVIATTN